MNSQSTDKFSAVLHSIIETYEKDILLDPFILNILDELNAYDECPAKKFVFKILFSEGIIERFVNLGKWSNECNQLIYQVENSTGFQQDVLTSIFNDMAIGLGWIKGIDSLKESAQPMSKKMPSIQLPIVVSNPHSYLYQLLQKRKFIYKKGRKYGIMNYLGEIIHNAVYDEIDEYPSIGLIPVRKGKLWGYIDSESQYSIEPKFDVAYSFCENKATVKCSAISECEYVIDKKGNMIVLPIYESISPYSYGLARVVIGDYQGYIDHSGEIRIPIEYPYPPLSVQSEQEILLTTNYGTKIVDKENNTLAFFNNIYYGAIFGSIGNGKFIVREDQDDFTSLYGVIDRTNKIVVPCRYDELSIIRDYGNNNVFIKATLGSKYGILSVNGGLLVPFLYDDIGTETSRNQFIVRKNKKWGVVDISGEIKIPFMYDNIRFINQDCYLVDLESKIGWINDANEWIKDGIQSDLPFSDDYELIDCISIDNENEIYFCHKGRTAYVFDYQGNELLKFNCPTIVDVIR